MSQKSCNEIVTVLQDRYDVGVSYVNNSEDLEALADKKPDLAFMGVKFVHDQYGRKIWVSTFLEARGIAHTGSSAAAAALEQDKSLSKQQIINSGLNTPRYLLLKKGEPAQTDSLRLSFPLFIKPSSLGGGAGVDDKSIVHNFKDLTRKIEQLNSVYNSDILVEEYLPGREFSVAVLKNEFSGKLQGMPIEMLPEADVNGDRILSLALKSGSLETPVAAVVDEELREGLIVFALKIFESLGARDYGRIDMRMDEFGVLNFIEANLIPSLINGSGNFPKACEINLGLPHDEMLFRIVQLGLSRNSFTKFDLFATRIRTV
ncbi:MAG: hypothetical protein WCJ24_02140 [Candidatus Saccharibacteria bacterium]